jgi:carboxypeptidase Taq
MHPRLDELKARLRDTYDLDMVGSLLQWDQTTYMPPGGAEARGRQMALLGRLAHESRTHADIGRMLEDLREYEHGLPYDSDEAGLLRLTRRTYERATRVPLDLVSEFQNHVSATYQAWTEARPAADFRRMVPHLEKTLSLSRRWADCFPGYESIADPLIDAMDFGMKASTVRPLFAELHAALVPLVRAIAGRPRLDTSCLAQPVPEADQERFAVEVIRRFGYDFERGRIDRTHHPFMTKFSLGDVRITTKYRQDDVSFALFSTFHEAGHALYEQGISAEYEGTPLANGTSAGVHESQSRLWENIVGRSHAFCGHFYPRLQETMAGFRNVSLDAFYRAINCVEPSLIRIEADEVTYNLHVMLRFDLELDMLEGRLAVKDLAEAWRARIKADFGLEVPSDRDGALQDVHWYSATIGGVFQGYTLGNIMSAQFYEAACRRHPRIPEEIGRGEFATLLGWLKENIHRHGAKYTAEEIVQRATGGPLTIAPYMRYLWGKYGPLYGVAEPEAARARA